MNNEKRKRKHSLILYLLLSFILLLSCISIMQVIQLNLDRNRSFPMNYLSEPVRNDQTWDSIDI